MTSLRGTVRGHRPLMLLAFAMAALALVAAGGLVLDDRALVGAPIWLKPFRFSVSFAVYAVTLAWLISLLPRWCRVAGWSGTAIAPAPAVEMVVIVGQVPRGRRSHFNVATPLDSALWAAMGVTIAGTNRVRLAVFAVRAGG